GAAVFFWRGKARRSEAPEKALQASSSLVTNSPNPISNKPEFQKLKGKWLRPDGGYVLEIRSVEDTGTIDAAYFNPNPIHVARAYALKDGAATKVFVELRDINYPGSNYTLTYDPAVDRLAGLYFQAIMKETFEVVFVRQPSK